jgi:hypothetical protein
MEQTNRDAQNGRQLPHNAPETGRHPYNRPRLVLYGGLGALTQEGSKGASEIDGTGNKGMT